MKIRKERGVLKSKEERVNRGEESARRRRRRSGGPVGKVVRGE